MGSADNGLSMLKRRIFRDRGFDCSQYKENFLKRRIGVRMRANNVDTFEDYILVLRRRPEEYGHLLDELTINVTQFFRDTEVFTRIRDEILPELIEAKVALSARTLRIWSAGCSSGEEAYSLAITALEVLGDRAKDWNIRVVGSDFDEKSLMTAREGVYYNLKLPWRLDDSKYFIVSNKPDGWEYQVRPEIRALLRFEKINLLDFKGKRYYDLILCRNVLIYFGREVQHRIIEELTESISGEGFLVLGKSETAGYDAPGRLEPVFPADRIYRVLPKSWQKEARLKAYQRPREGKLNGNAAK